MVVGRPRADSRVGETIERLGLADAVSFVSDVSDDRLVELYAEASVAVVPSLYEGFSLPAIEAMACGVPLVATTGGALPEVVGTDGETGLLVPPGDPGALAWALGRVLDDPVLAARLAEAGRRRALERFTWRACAEGTVEHYRWVMSATPSRAGGRAQRSPRRAMLTVRYERLGFVAGDRVLDLGCGGGRHAFEAMRRGAAVVALDADAAEVKDTAALMAALAETDERHPGQRRLGVGHGRRRRVPALRRRLLRPDHRGRGARARARRPAGPRRAGPGAAAGRDDRRHRAPLVARAGVLGPVRRLPPGSRWPRAHLPARTFSASRLAAAGFELYASHHAHALHSPYWWLKCAVGVADDRPPAGPGLPPRARLGHHRRHPVDPGPRAPCSTR